MAFKQYNVESPKWKINDSIDLTEYGEPEILNQVDTYYRTFNGDRLKIRDEGDRVYAIRYNRPNDPSMKESHYDFFPINDYDQFLSVFGNAMQKEIVVSKKREVYLKENYRIHKDIVEGLGMFLEIEIVITCKEHVANAENQMKELVTNLNLDDYEIVEWGYRELLIKNDDKLKDYNYYFESNKIFWVVNEDIEGTDIKANSHIPCLYINERNEIVRLDFTIKDDNLRYTMFRRAAGEAYGLHISVLLMHDGMLFRLDGTTCDFDSLGRSDVIIDRRFLAPIKHNYKKVWGSASQDLVHLEVAQ